MDERILLQVLVILDLERHGVSRDRGMLRVKEHAALIRKIMGRMDVHQKVYNLTKVTHYTLGHKTNKEVT